MIQLTDAQFKFIGICVASMLVVNPEGTMVQAVEAMSGDEIEDLFGPSKLHIFKDGN